MQTRQFVQEQGRFGISRAELVAVHFNHGHVWQVVHKRNDSKGPRPTQFRTHEGKITACVIQNHTQLHREQQQLVTSLIPLIRQSNKTTLTPDSPMTAWEVMFLSRE